MKKINYISDFKSWSKGFSYSVPITIRFSETDMYGHVNNTAVFVYYEEARVKYLQYLGLFGTSEFNEYGVVVSDLQSDYLKQLFFGEIIEVFVKIAEIGNTSYDIHYMVKNEKAEVVLTARGRLVNISMETGKPAVIPPAMRAIMEQQMKETVG